MSSQSRHRHQLPRLPVLQEAKGYHRGRGIDSYRALEVLRVLLEVLLEKLGLVEESGDLLAGVQREKSCWDDWGR